MLNIPQTFHQIWLGTKPIPPMLRKYAKTWKDNHPKWNFELWDDDKSSALMKESYPNLLNFYQSLPYLTQRVDVIKYLVLHEFGGLYMDFDCECLKPIDDLLTYPICIGLEPYEHEGFPVFLGSAFMAATPCLEFFDMVLLRSVERLAVLDPLHQELGKYKYVMETTGPTLLNRVYVDYDKKDMIRLLPPKLIGPFRNREATLYRENKNIGYGSEQLSEAYAIHHFIGSWL